ncbi:hypothetical protein D9M72_523300 [compost metagenome]
MLVPAIGNAHDRGERDDAALAALAHAGCDGAREAKDAFQIDVEGQVPLVVGECCKRGAMGNAGIGDDDVDAAVPLFQVSDQRVGRRCRTDVVIGELGGAAGLLDRVNRGRCLALEDVRDDDVIALGGKGPGGRLANADAGTGDDDNAGRLGRICHVHLSCQSITSPELGPSVWPTNRPADGEARNETVAAISSGSPKRPSGSCAFLASRQSLESPITSGVLIGPGATALTRTPRLDTSRASALVMPMIAALADE